MNSLFELRNGNPGKTFQGCYFFINNVLNQLLIHITYS